MGCAEYAQPLCSEYSQPWVATQVTLNTEPHGFDSCRGHTTEKLSSAGYVALDTSFPEWQPHKWQPHKWQPRCTLARVVAFAHGSLLSNDKRDRIVVG